MSIPALEKLINMKNYPNSDKASVNKTWRNVGCTASDEVKAALAKIKPSYAANKLIEVLIAAGIEGYSDRNTARHRCLLECAVQTNWNSLKPYILGASCFKTKFNNTKQTKVIVNTPDLEISFYLGSPQNLYPVRDGVITFKSLNRVVYFDQNDLKSRNLLNQARSPQGAICQIQESNPVSLPIDTTHIQDNSLVQYQEPAPEMALTPPTQSTEGLFDFSYDQFQYLPFIAPRDDFNDFREFESPEFNDAP